MIELHGESSRGQASPRTTIQHKMYVIMILTAVIVTSVIVTVMDVIVIAVVS